MSDKTTPKPLNPEGISAILAGEKDTEQDCKRGILFLPVLKEGK